MGLIASIATLPCLIEPFRNQPKPSEVRSCLSKLFHVIGDFERQTKREDRTVREDELPQLWIITPCASDDLLSTFGATPSEDWLTGIYFFPKGLKTAIIAIGKAITRRGGKSTRFRRCTCISSGSKRKRYYFFERF